jgi:hypothetical protein
MLINAHTDNALHRALARKIAAKLGDKIGNREAVILADPDVRAHHSSDYPTCWVFTSGDKSKQMVYHKARNEIVA